MAAVYNNYVIFKDVTPLYASNGSKYSRTESVGIRPSAITPPPSSKQWQRALNPVSMKSKEDR